MKKYLLGFVVFLLAFGILTISVLKCASPKYAFSSPSPMPSDKVSDIDVQYNLPYPGSIMPDSPFWFLKAGRDKLWYIVTLNLSKKAELALLFADKRLVMSKTLFEKQKPDLAFSTLTKSEKYLETAVNMEIKARQKGENTDKLLTEISLASLKHRQIIGEILEIAPEDARPSVIVLENKVKNIYKMSKEALNNKGIPAPISPFDGD